MVVKPGKQTLDSERHFGEPGRPGPPARAARQSDLKARGLLSLTEYKFVRLVLSRSNADITFTSAARQLKQAFTVFAQQDLGV